MARQLEQNGIRPRPSTRTRSQSQRQKALDAFTSGKVRVLVATDIVARGIDVEGISHVINYELPDDAENYVHRIGRTARAGQRRRGRVVVLCARMCRYLRGVERLVKQPLTVREDHSWHSPSRGGLPDCLGPGGPATGAGRQGAGFGIEVGALIS